MDKYKFYSTELNEKFCIYYIYDKVEVNRARFQHTVLRGATPGKTFKKKYLPAVVKNIGKLTRATWNRTDEL